MSWWTMSGLDHDNRENGLEERFYRIAEGGFNGINGFIPNQEKAEEWHNLLERYGFSFSVNAYPKSASEMAHFLDQAKSFGRINFINAQVMTPFLTGRLLRHFCLRYTLCPLKQVFLFILKLIEERSHRTLFGQHAMWSTLKIYMFNS